MSFSFLLPWYTMGCRIPRIGFYLLKYYLGEVVPTPRLKKSLHKRPVTYRLLKIPNVSRLDHTSTTRSLFVKDPVTTPTQIYVVTRLPFPRSPLPSPQYVTRHKRNPIRRPLFEPLSRYVSLAYPVVRSVLWSSCVTSSRPCALQM